MYTWRRLRASEPASFNLAHSCINGWIHSAALSSIGCLVSLLAPGSTDHESQCFILLQLVTLPQSQARGVLGHQKISEIHGYDPISCHIGLEDFVLNQPIHRYSLKGNGGTLMD